eukprot:TRINITY_DN12787_c0_g1_i1.p3 TRINITY_DN12787_c0_g1~~TRINITY_DN12787_c0_g1_i1.p3  ORF type:complete len:226 (+),score=47.46 TRINITY_DN12787_c0_g1_i1:103-780(+)
MCIRDRLLLELQKSYKGDSRFVLDERFTDDVEIEKLPNLIKQMNADYIDQLEGRQQAPEEVEEQDPEEKELVNERLNALQILESVLPEDQKRVLRASKLNEKDDRKVGKSVVIQRFDPSLLGSSKLLVTNKEETSKKGPQANKKNNEKKGKKQPKIESGIDIKKKNSMKVDKLLEKGVKNGNVIASKLKKQPKAPVLRKADIKYSAWKEIIGQKDEGAEGFKLFG